MLTGVRCARSRTPPLLVTPGPIAGAGLPGLIFLLAVAFSAGGGGDGNPLDGGMRQELAAGVERKPRSVRG